MTNKKRGVSIVIGYVILVTVAITMSFLVYAWMKSYVPQEKLECPDDVSIRILSAECLPGGYNQIKMEIKNTGFFDIQGFVINGKDTNDNLVEISEGNLVVGNIKPGGDVTILIGEGTGDKEQITSVEITPLKEETDEDTEKKQVAICTEAVATKVIDVECGIFPGIEGSSFY